MYLLNKILSNAKGKLYKNSSEEFCFFFLPYCYKNRLVLTQAKKIVEASLQKNLPKT